MGKLFISYRREDAPGDARGICDRLGRSFGQANVFMDVDKLLAGQRFDRELDKALSKCDVLVAVIGSRWVELLFKHAQSGKRDYVRDEIAAALTRDIIVIPVMVGDEAHMPPLPPAEDLPENIRDLVFYQKHNIAHESFGRDAAHLIAAIKAVLRARRSPRPWWAIAAAAMIVMSLIAALGGYLMGVIPRSAPSVTQHIPPTNGSTASAPPNSDAVSKKAEEEAKQITKQRAETAAKAAEDEAARKAAEETKRQAEAGAAKKKADEEAARTKAGPNATTQRTGIPSSVFSADAVLLGQFNYWGAYTVVRSGKKVCFALAGSSSSKNDDATYAFVSTRPSENVLNEFSTIMNYQVKEAAGSTLEVGNERYALWGQGNGLWIENTAETSRIVDSMRTSPELTIWALTQDGAVKKEVYSLRGFAPAIDRIARECR